MPFLAPPASWKDLLDAAPDSMFLVDSNGTIQWVNPASYKLSGVDPLDYLGRNVRDLESAGVFYPSVARIVLEQKVPRTIIQTLLNGKRVVCTGVPLFDKNGNLTGVLAVTRDVKELANNIRESYEKSGILDDLLMKLAEAEKRFQVYSEEINELRRRQMEIPEVITTSSQMRRVVDLIRRVAPTDATVLLQGETGVGKSLIAKAIHQLSERADRPFVEVSCSLIPENLLESELFGYVPGAFTGAHPKGKVGLVEVANSGTLFLDEIGDLPISLQGKLLFLLQERKFTKVGSPRPLAVDIRVIAATHRDLEKMVQSGLFRQDLYYRLNVISVTVPPLRERVDDIPQLALLFLERFQRKYKKHRSFSREAMAALMSHAWPGNVRELENAVEHAVITSNTPVIQPDDLPVRLGDTGFQAVRYPDRVRLLKDTLEDVERHVYALARKQFGSTREMARALGVNQSTVVRKLNKYFGKESATGSSRVKNT